MPKLVKIINSFTAGLHHDYVNFEMTKVKFRLGNYPEIIKNINRIYYRGENLLLNKLSPELVGIYININSIDRYNISLDNLAFDTNNNIIILIDILNRTFNSSSMTYFFFKVMKKLKILFIPCYLEKVLEFSSKSQNITVALNSLHLLFLCLFFEKSCNEVKLCSNDKLLLDNIKIFQKHIQTYFSNITSENSRNFISLLKLFMDEAYKNDASIVLKKIKERNFHCHFTKKHIILNSEDNTYFFNFHM